MGFSVEIVADSFYETRLTTFVLTYPRIIHSEFMTHRVFSRNSASSRALPALKQIEAVETEPFVPISWGKNQKGMVASSEEINCEAEWLEARDKAVSVARKMLDKGLHKQLVNRIIEPFTWITVVATTSFLKNFFNLRCHPDAEPHMQRLATLMRDAFEASKPVSLVRGEWHLPLAGSGLLDDKIRESVCNCAAVSYLKHTASPDIYEKLRSSGHWSPFEHQAQAHPDAVRGNLGKGWQQLRKVLEVRCE